MGRAIRVCRVINAMRLGGVQMMLVKLLPALKDLGAEPAVCVTRMKGPVAKILRDRTGIKTTHIHVSGRIHPGSIRRLALHFREQRFDVVHTHMFSSNLPATIAAKMAGVPCIVSQIHNVDTYEHPGQRILDRLVNQWRDEFLCVSGAVRDDVARNLWLPPERFQVFYNAIDADFPSLARPRADVRTELRLTDENVVLIHAARLHQQKNHEGLLLELPRLLDEHHNLRVLLAGDGRLEKKLKELTYELKIDHAVRFLGFRDDIPSLMAASDIAVLPSHKEGLPNVVLEAWQSGLPVVATNAGGTREIIDHGINGFVTNLRDMKSFGDHVSALAGSFELRRTLGEAGRAKASLFTVQNLAKKTMTLYENVLAAKGRA